MTTRIAVYSDDGHVVLRLMDGKLARASVDLTSEQAAMLIAALDHAICDAEGDDSPRATIEMEVAAMSNPYEQ